MTGVRRVVGVLFCCILLMTFCRADDRPHDSADNAALEELLRRFDKVSAQGFVPTQRRGSTGIGHTLEQLLGVPENNDPGGDFRGIEIKAEREQEPPNPHRRVNLFLKEPTWLDDWSGVERIRRLGYEDPNGRDALYQTVTARDNSAGMRLEVDVSANALLLIHNADAIAWWDRDILHRRLIEKHTQTVFVGAAVRGAGADEEFHYRTLVWCGKPSVDRFLKIAADGDVLVELRMHVAANGTVRNHGTAFRIRKHRISDLYEHRVPLRPRSSTGESSDNDPVSILPVDAETE